VKVHIAALLIMLTVITPQACYKCEVFLIQAGQSSFAVDLDFGRSSVDGYVTYTGPVLRVVTS